MGGVHKLKSLSNDDLFEVKVPAEYVHKLKFNRSRLYPGPRAIDEVKGRHRPGPPGSD